MTTQFPPDKLTINDLWIEQREILRQLAELRLKHEQHNHTSHRHLVKTNELLEPVWTTGEITNAVKVEPEEAIVKLEVERDGQHDNAPHHAQYCIERMDWFATQYSKGDNGEIIAIEFRCNPHGINFWLAIPQ